MTHVLSSLLPDPFLQENGQRIHTRQQWVAHRPSLLAPLLALQYGPLPPAPPALRAQLLHSALLPRWNDARLHTLRVHAPTAQAASFCMQVWVPESAAPAPVILSGDGCWHNATDAVKTELLGRGYALAVFNRAELAADAPGASLGGPCPAVATWAWGYHRCVDALLQLDGVHPEQIAIVGHSRGGKAALLAGATDERIALTSANNSGAAGAGCYRCKSPGAETLADLVQAFPHWLSPRMNEFIGRENALPFDQHFLKALIAPRALLSTEAHDDLWANPEGSWQTHCAAREVYRFLGADDRIALRWRPGGHQHSLADWRALLDFADTVFRAGTTHHCADDNPFADTAPAYRWASPTASGGG